MGLRPVSGVLILPWLLALTLLVGRVCAGPAIRVRVHSPLERLFICWLLGIIVISWVGTVLAVLSLFRWWLFLLVLLVVGGLALWRERSSASSAAGLEIAVHPTPWPALLLLVVLLGGAGWLFARPAESFLLTDDSAVYTIGGIVLARDGSLFFEPEPIYQLPGDAAPPGNTMASPGPDDSISLTPYTDLLRQFYFTGPMGVSSRHLGPFHQWRLIRATTEIGFLPLPKVWAALCVWLLGQPCAVWAAPFFGLAGLAALYALARRLLGWRTGLGAVLLLGVSLPQIWFARSPISEVHTQTLFLGGMYLAVLARQHARAALLARALAIWSGLALAALTVVRFEAMVILLFLVAFLLASWGREELCRKEISRVWLTTLCVGSVFGMIMSLSVAPYYYFTRALALMSPELNRLFVVALLGVVGIGSLLWHLRTVGDVRLRAVARRLGQCLPALVGVGWALWGIVGAWRLLGAAWGSSLAGWVAQYWTLPGLILSIAGALWLIRREHKRSGDSVLVALLGVGVFFLHLYSANALVNPVHPWAMRRLVPIVMPVLALCAAAPLTRPADSMRCTEDLAESPTHGTLVRDQSPREGLFRRRVARPGLAQGLSGSKVGRRPSMFSPKPFFGWASRLRPGLARVARRLAPTGLALALIAQAFGIFRCSYPILLHQERQGLWNQLEALAKRLPAGAVLLFDDGPLGARLTQATELVFGFPSYTLRDTDAIQSNSRVVDRLIESAMARDRPVYLVLTGENLRWRPDRWLFASQGAQRFSSPVLRPVWGRPPNAADIVPHAFLADLYAVLPAGDGPTKAGSRRVGSVPAGPGSYPYLRSGFHRLEGAEANEDFRWTKGDALVIVPWPDPDPTSPADFCLRLRVSGWRPPQAEPPHLVVKAEGITLFDQQVADLLAPGTLAIPAESVSNQGAPQLEIRIVTDTWNPAALRGSLDRRDLGIMFFGLQVLPLWECSGGSSFQSGFYASEGRDASARYRWTNGDALFSAPWPGPEPSELAQFCVHIDLSSWRPSGVRSPRLLVEAEGAVLFDQELDGYLGRHVLGIPAHSITNRGAPELEIRIASDTWSPASYSDGRDTRQLGIMIYGIQVVPLDQCLAGQ